jgi:hypothetical protein
MVSIDYNRTDTPIPQEYQPILSPIETDIISFPTLEYSQRCQFTVQSYNYNKVYDFFYHDASSTPAICTWDDQINDNIYIHVNPSDATVREILSYVIGSDLVDRCVFVIDEPYTDIITMENYLDTPLRDAPICQFNIIL